MRDKVMRILLVHNPKAGSEEHEGDTLMEALKRPDISHVTNLRKRRDSLKH
jgi:hypothetical protein